MIDYLIASNKIILFDMMDTLMYGGNKFSGTENYAKTYRQTGGTVFSDEEAQSIVQSVFCRMQHDYKHPDCYDMFRHVRDYMQDHLWATGRPTTDLDYLAETFAWHELGKLPDSVCEALHGLSKTHRLGVVSNLWSGKALFVDAFRRSGILHLFETLVFSSDHACIKPSPRLFRLALDQLGVPADEVLFVGDDWERDVLAAQALGMSAIWVNNDGAKERSGPQVRSVAELIGH